jgi:hypothetical protein
MLLNTMSALYTHIDDYLRRAFRLQEEIVSLQPPVKGGQVAALDNRLHLFLVHIERETAGGISFNTQRSAGDSHFRSSLPEWRLNVYAALAAVFGEKQYGEGLKLLSAVTAFLQANNRFAVTGADEPLILEPVNLSFGELSNLWAINGNQYYPSLLCKVRNVTVDANEIKHIGTIIKEGVSEVRKSETP